MDAPKKAKKLLEFRRDSAFAAFSETQEVNENLAEVKQKLQEINSVADKIDKTINELGTRTVTVDVLGAKMMTFKGDKGEPGETIVGPPGPKGPEGPQGKALTWDALTLKQKAELKGEKGDPGKSIVGPRGLQGKQGEQGKPGKDAPIKDIENLAQEVKKLKEFFEIEDTKISDGSSKTNKYGINPHGPTRSGVSNLIELGDVSVSSPANGDVLTYNSVTSKWTNQAAAGGSLSVLVATGTINDSNLAFTFVSEPTLIIMNGGVYRATGGAITWTYLAGTVTLSSPVGTGGSIFGLG